MVFPPYTYLILRVFTGKNKTPALTKSTNMDIWVVGTSNQLFTRDSYTQVNKNKK